MRPQLYPKSPISSVHFWRRYWYLEYQRSHFSNQKDYFDKPGSIDGRPPVFVRCESWRNVIVDPDVSEQEKDRLLSLIPDGERHKWFGSMNSSQALALSILGNLALSGSLHYLSRLTDDDGLPLITKTHVSVDNFEMEHKIDFLGEPRSTRLDGYIRGDYQIAIECKFTEAEVGSCSRPRLEPADSNYESEHCNGDYSIQRSRNERCSLTNIGVLYWRYIPSLFKLKSNIDLRPCPLNKTYQLVRNVLAIGVKRDGTASPQNGHVILIYDERNPAFQQGGDGLIAYFETRQALIEPAMLRKCSWQRIIQLLRDNSVLSWLTEQLETKYGL